jgi:hypothetical protein
MERETGFEPATSTLARSHSTTELFPLARTLTVPHGPAGGNRSPRANARKSREIPGDDGTSIAAASRSETHRARDPRRDRRQPGADTFSSRDAGSAQLQMPSAAPIPPPMSAPFHVESSVVIPSTASVSTSLVGPENCGKPKIRVNHERCRCSVPKHFELQRRERYEISECSGRQDDRTGPQPDALNSLASCRLMLTRMEAAASRIAGLKARTTIASPEFTPARF